LTFARSDAKILLLSGEINPHFSQRFVYEATKMPAKSEVASGNKRGILDSMLSAISAETSFAAAFSKPQ
jgi:hypothetical protein